MSYPLTFTACNVASDIRDKCYCRADANFFRLGAHAKPIPEQMLARQYKLEWTQAYRDLMTVAGRSAKEACGSVCMLFALTHRPGVQIRPYLRCDVRPGLLLTVNATLKKKQCAHLYERKRPNVAGLASL